LGNGNGGKVVLWSDNYTKVDGAILARGGVLGGNGGQIETSSHGTLVANSVADATASRGQAGSWLLDPSDVTIVASGGSPLTGGVFNPGGASGTVSNGTINAALNAGTSVTISTTAGSGGSGHLVQNPGAPINKTAGPDATLSLIASLDLVLNDVITASGTGKLNVSLDASGGGTTTYNAILAYKNITTNGGTLQFLSGVYIPPGSVASNFTTAGGAVTFNGDVLIANQNGLVIDTVTGSPASAGASVTFGGKIDSGNSYQYSATPLNWNQALAAAKSGSGTNVGDTYMATITSSLESVIAVKATGFVDPQSISGANTIWLGGARLDSGTPWRWQGGPENGQIFNTTPTGVNPPPGVYQNWLGAEPNEKSTNAYLGFFSPATLPTGKWGDYNGTLNFLGASIMETNLAASPLTVNAGTSAVTFNGKVGSINPLASLTVTGPTAINGGQITTEQGQTYNSLITLGSASTLMNSTKSTLQLDSNISYSGAAGSVLTMRAANDVIVSPGVSITSTGGALTTSLTADTANTGSGAITLRGPISTNGGAINLSASSGITANNAAIDSGGGAITITNNRSGNIAFTSGSTITAGSGNISITNGAAAGITGGGTIALLDLSGAALSVSNNVTDLAAGQNAITLDGPLTASGAVTVLSKAGDILVNKNITSTLTNSPSAIILAAATPKTAVDNTGGNVKLAGSQLTVDATSRAIIYTGSIADSTGMSSSDPGYPGAGHYRYNVAYNNIGRGVNNTGTYVQYREQPTLTMTLPGKVYDGLALDATDWTQYNPVSGWVNGDTSSVNSLSGNLSLNGSTATVAKNQATYTVALDTLLDTLGYKLVVPTTSYTITPAPLTITGDTFSKIYGTNDPQPLTYTTTGLVSGETVATALTGNLGRLSGENVGSYAQTQGSLLANNGNYTINFNPSTLSITPNLSAPVTVIGDTLTKNYASNDPTLTYTTTGLLNNRVVSSYGPNGAIINTTITDSNSGSFSGNLGRNSGENVGSYATTQGSLASSNYAIVFNPGSLSIIKNAAAALSVTGDTASKNYGSNDPLLTYTVAGLVTNKTVQSYDVNGNQISTTLNDTQNTALSGNLGRNVGENVGGYATTQGSLVSANYAFNFTPGALNINQAASAPITVTADAVSKNYGNNDPTLTYVTTGLINTTVQSYDTTGSLQSVAINNTAGNSLTGNLGRNSGENVGSYDITQGSLASANYVINYVANNLTITPNTASPISITAVAVGKTFGSDDPNLSYNVSGGSFVNTTVQSYDASGARQNVTINDTAASALTGHLGRISGETIGNYSITQGSVAAANYVINYTPANLTINPTVLAIVANAHSKEYGNNDPDLDYTFTNPTQAQVNSYDPSGTLSLTAVPGGGGTATFTGHLGRPDGEDVG
ncbi:beta strand repeat-containing protein, partial [Collimonas sp.]|uniref:beta strand repeat-containing protein n=1 Tax=Collimonas sp. TaxID=1963772 RepID=UPI0037BF9A7A